MDDETTWTRRQSLASVLFVSSYIVFYGALTLAALLAAMLASRFDLLFAVLAVAATGVMLAPIATSFRRQSHRMLLSDRAQVMEADSRVVLYLRSFMSESAFLKPF